MDSDDDDYYEDSRSDYRGSHSQSRGQSHSAGGDMGSELKKSICVADDGKLEIFGKSFDLGSREAAFFLRRSSMLP